MKRMFSIFLMLGLMFFFSWLLLMLYGDRYRHGFIPDETGVTVYTPPSRQKRNRTLILLVVIGMLRGKPSILDAASTAKGGETLRIP
jgi:hypothetical protein